MAEEEFYDIAARKLVRKYEGVIGQAAEGIAKKDDHVEFEDGEIKSFSGGSGELDELVQAYEDTIGNVALRLAKQVIADVEGSDEADLPDRLKK
ncbi:MAG: hypothetical protein ABEJ69_03850 [Candidatus Nanohaloarchaea archaeon]